MTMAGDIDVEFMQRALLLAKQGEFTASPNPCVGCVLVRDGEIVGEGCHWQAGQSHAECAALAQAQERARGATCYVTLEPCSHHGRTGPCVSALMSAGVSRVVIASEDPNPQVDGKGIAALKTAGIAVTVGPLAAEAKALNKGFFSRMLRQRPYVRAKMAMSLDGRIAMANGESQWIVAPHVEGQRLRALSDAIVTGSGTVAQDNCRLTVRNFSPPLPENISLKQPLRVVVASQLKISAQANIFHQPGKSVVAYCDTVPSAVQQAWFEQVPAVAGIALAEKNKRVDLKALLTWLAEQEINNVLVEAGPQLVGAFLQAELLDEMVIFMAPKLLGHEAQPLAVLPGLSQLKDHLAGKFTAVIQQGADLQLSIKFNEFGA